MARAQRIPPDEMYYPFRVRRLLWDKCLVKAGKASPPMHMRYVLETLLHKWLESDANGGPIPLGPAAQRRLPKTKPRVKKRRPQEPQADRAVDIGQSF